MKKNFTKITALLLLMTYLIAFCSIGVRYVSALYDDDIQTLYSMDGREITVYKTEVEAYKKVGWYENKSEVQKTLYSADGREITVYKAEVEAYKKVGWYESKELVKMCSLDGRYRMVPKNKVANYQKVGWYLTQSEVIDPSKPMIALTYDDGPRAASTGRILDVLELFGARATFFVVGNLASKNPEILKRANDIGCLVGNHTYSHPELTKLSKNTLKTEIDSTSSAIYNAIGKYPTLIRPPYGDYNQFVKDNTDKPLILWSVDTLDWKYKNADHVINHVLTNVKDGDIVLMHDLYDTTAAATEKLVPELIKRGFQLVTVEELAKYKGKTMKAHNTYSSFR